MPVTGFKPRRAILYDLILPLATREEASRRIGESESLVKTFGGAVLLKVIQRRHHPGSTSYIGRAKLEEILAEALELGADLLIINDSLKPRQKFAIETVMEEMKINARNRHAMEVWDRVDLILGIFTRHARSAEAKLQLELARIRHQGPRIFGMGEDLSNQGGGIGTRGLGETNTEIMKRHLMEHTRRIEDKIERLERSRGEIRKRREKRGVKHVAIVGYTNAGKSALFRALTGKAVLVEDALFATLDTTTGKMAWKYSRSQLLLSDTIGFIRKLPLALVAAFRSTLEEAINGDVLLHVVDASDPEIAEKMAAVGGVMRELGMADLPCLTVFNKCDLLPPGRELPVVEGPSVRISALGRTGFLELLRAIHRILGLDASHLDSIRPDELAGELPADEPERRPVPVDFRDEAP
ncbi:MAG: GTPase HflX [Spirochaetes bacterium]|nr:GTPase HflX [Spirochaetota bacterium]